MKQSSLVRIPWPPRIGVVIGTYGTTSYIRLQLEARRRYWPGVPLLIHDDSSPESRQLAELCKEYNATYYTTAKRLTAGVGDMSTIITGLDWAHKNQFDILVKISRRFLILHDWVSVLERLAYNTQYPTYSTPCGEYVYGCRSECFALHVPSWLGSSALREMRACMDRGTGPSSEMENWYSRQALKIYNETASMRHRSHNRAFRGRPKSLGVVYWNDIMGYSRHTRAPDVLWHNADFPEDYLNCARMLEMNDLRLEDFRWIYTPDTADRVPAPQPPIASPALGPSQQEIDRQRIEISSKLFDPIEETRAYPRVARQKIDLFSLTTKIVERRLTNGMDISQFDIWRWLRLLTAPMFPFIVSRTLSDTLNISNVWRKSSVNDAIAEPRHENFSKFVCQKSVELPGCILTIGPHPIGLCRHAAVVYDRRIHIFGLMENTTEASLLDVTAKTNGWDNLTLFAPREKGSAGHWIPELAKIDFQRVATILITMPGFSVRVLSALTAVIERDGPHIFVRVPGLPDQPAEDLVQVEQLLAALGYGVGVTGVDRDADGILLPFKKDEKLRRQAIYAWKKT